MLGWLKHTCRTINLRRLRWYYRPGKVISHFIAHDVEREVLVVSADEIDDGYLTVRARTNNLLYMSVGAVDEESFGPPQHVAIKDLWKWSGQSWGGLPDGTSITDADDSELDSATPYQSGSIHNTKVARSGCLRRLLVLPALFCFGVIGALRFCQKESWTMYTPYSIIHIEATWALPFGFEITMKLGTAYAIAVICLVLGTGLLLSAVWPTSSKPSRDAVE